MSLRVVVADDSGIFRDGLVALLSDAGVEVVGSVGDPPHLLRAVAQTRPDAVVVDVRMPPTFTDEGIRTAIDLRERHPDLGILVLSTYAEPSWVRTLTTAVSTGVGYLLKDRVGNVHRLLAAVQTVADGGLAIDEEVIARVRPPASVLDRLTVRQREVLALLAEGRSNQAITERLHASVRTVEVHVASILRDLDLPEEPGSNRRVLAALAYLGARS